MASGSHKERYSMHEVYELCRSCRQVDLVQLLAPIETEQSNSSGRSVKDYEDERAICIPNLTYAKALSNAECNLCRLVVECGRLAGLHSHFVHEGPYDIPALNEGARLDEREAEQAKTRPITVRCCLRPKLVWSSRNALGESDTEEPRLVSDGQVHIWFYKTREQPKALRFGRQGETSTRARLGLASFRSGGQSVDFIEAKSGLASWTVDVVRLFGAPTGDPSAANAVWYRRPIERKVNVGTLRSWVRECTDHHDHSVLDAVARARLQKLPPAYAIRAVNTATHEVLPLPEGAKYVALSYVWGKGRSIPSPFIPRTIRDAIDLANQLGFHWLWVDRLCIDQQNGAEKGALVSFIKDIFILAKLTIVAANGASAYAGLHGLGETSRETEAPYELNWTTHRTARALATPPSFNTMLAASSWRTRGWTFEEQVFSRRILYVFATEVMFSCERGTSRESTGGKFVAGCAGATWDSTGAPPSTASLLHAKFHNGASTSDPSIDARESVLAVEHYTSRDLSFEEDRITAFAGVVTATAMSDNPLDDMPLLAHGHPLPFFETALTWHHEEDTQRRRASNGKAFTPSWSWASAGCQVHSLDDGREHSRNDWFRYSLCQGYGVVGIPVDGSLALGSEFDLGSPDAMIASRPWDRKTDEDQDLLPDYKETVAPHEQPWVQKPSRLHLVTVVFNAHIQPWHEGQLSMTPAGSDFDLEAGHLGEWSLDYDLPDDWWVDASKLQSFAIVGGNAKMYIMLLAPHSEMGVFTRHGLLRTSILPFPLTLWNIIRSGNPRWMYIQLA